LNLFAQVSLEASVKKHESDDKIYRRLLRLAAIHQQALVLVLARVLALALVPVLVLALTRPHWRICKIAPCSRIP
jgi:hypothetical protein